jgi:protein SCO1/2
MTASLSRRAFAAALGVAAAAPLWARTAATAANAAELPGDSLYQLPSALTDQNGKPVDFNTLRGTPVLTSMFYTSCTMVCPMIFESVQRTLRALPAAERAKVKVLMVSFDPARDSAAVLKRTAEAHGCDAAWTLARGEEPVVRAHAAALGFQYRRLADGEFNHSSLVLLLDREGRVAARSGRLDRLDPALVSATRKALA